MAFNINLIDERRRRQSISLAAWAIAIKGLTGIAIATVFFPNVSAFCFEPTNRNFHIEYIRSKSFPKKNICMTSQDIDCSYSDTSRYVDELLELAERKKEKDESLDDNAVRDLFRNLSSEENYILDDKSPSLLFDPLVGYYNVSYTLTSRPNDNPVGGKWTRGLWTVKRTMQHVLPPLPVVPAHTNNRDDSGDQNESVSVASKSVAQVINAIRLELLWGFVSVWVLLRGDAVPLKLDPAWTKSSDEIGIDDSIKQKSPSKLLPNLSDRTVKAYFDRPRIGVSLRSRNSSKTFLKRVLTLGPTSAVVLDTPYADDRIRLGKGGTSGSQFLFNRLPETDKEARDGWKWVLEENSKGVGRSLTKKSLVFRLGILGLAFSIINRIAQQRWMKVIAGTYALVSGISIFGLVRSTGGIETEGDTYMKGKQ